MRTQTNIFSLLLIVVGVLFALLGFASAGTVPGGNMVIWFGVAMILFGWLINHTVSKKTGPSCQESVKYNAVKCKHCQSVVCSGSV